MGEAIVSRIRFALVVCLFVLPIILATIQRRAVDAAYEQTYYAAASDDSLDEEFRCLPYDPHGDAAEFAQLFPD